MPEIVRHGTKYVAKRLACRSCTCEFLIKLSEATWVNRFGYEYAEGDPHDKYLTKCPECGEEIEFIIKDSERNH